MGQRSCVPRIACGEGCRWQPRYGLAVVASIRPIWLGCLVTLLPCGCDLPRDPEESYDRIRGGAMRVGVAHNPPWTSASGDTFAGVEPELLQEFAAALRSRIEWTHGAEGELLRSLERGELDVVVGGLVASTPWSAHVALTRPYVTLNGDDHVMALRKGENRWLLELERFLASRRAAVHERLVAGAER